MPSKSGSSSPRQSGSRSGGRGTTSRGGSSGGGRSQGSSGGGGPKRGGQGRGSNSSDAGRGAGGNKRRSNENSRGNRGSGPSSGRSDSRGGPRGNSSDRNSSRGGSSGGYKGRNHRDAPKKPARAETSGWGSVAQHGAAGATIGQRVFEQEAAEQMQFTADERRKYQERQARRDKVNERQEGLREQARKAIERGGLPQPAKDTKATEPTVERMPLPGRPPNPPNVKKLMERVAGPEKAERGWRLFKRAAKEFENEQYTDARKTVKPLAEAYNVADLHELHGLTLYRLGKWEEAIEELETFRRVSGTAEQNPVLMDCHRALGNWADVSYLWSELGELSPSAELVSEGRIVMAGSQADQGFIDSGIRTLEKGWKIPKQPMEHHLRRAYALADLLERDGKLPKSRKLFAWIASKDATFGDAADRAHG